MGYLELQEDLMRNDKEMKEHTKVYEDSEVPCFDPPAQNEWEKARSNSNGYDQSGMKK